jgi:hypothetical protein
MVDLIVSLGGGIPLLSSRILALPISRVEPGHQLATRWAQGEDGAAPCVDVHLGDPAQCRS